MLRPRPELIEIAMAPALATSPAVNLSTILNADGALRELGRDLDEAWRAERVAAGRPGLRLRANCESLARQILATPARSKDGLKVKSRAALWALAAGRDDLLSSPIESPDIQAVKAALKGVLALA